MNNSARFIPSAIAGLAVLGCLLSSGPQGTLLDLPAAFQQAANALGAANGLMGMLGGGAKSQSVDPSIAVNVARLVYLVPLLAIAIIIQNLRGMPVGRLQISAGIVWLVVVFGVPPLAVKILLESNTFLKEMASLAGQNGSSPLGSMGLGTGGWAIILAAVGSLVSGFGLMPQIDQGPTPTSESANPPAPAPSQQGATGQPGILSNHTKEALANAREIVQTKIAPELQRAAADTVNRAKEKAPEIAAKATELMGMAGQSAAKAFHRAETTMGDPKRRRFIVSAVVIAAVVIFGGGWLIASRIATAKVRDRVEALIIRANLSGVLTYNDLSASPFGSATASGVSLKLSPTLVITADSLRISDVDIHGDQIYGAHLRIKNLAIPAKELLRARNDMGGFVTQAVALGYTKLVSTLDLSFKYGDQKLAFDFSVASPTDDVGFEVKLGLANIPPAMLETLSGLSNAQAQNNPAAMFTQGLASLGLISQVTLTTASITVDNRGLQKRADLIPDAAMPSEQHQRPAQIPMTETELVRAGMLPSQAKASLDALSSWVANGGKLRIESNLTKPIQLFRPGRGFVPFDPAFSSLPEFLAAINGKIAS